MPPDQDFFAPPPFKPQDGLQRLRRELRELGLTERAGQFEHRGQPVARAELRDGVLQASRVGTRGSSTHTPDWQTGTITDSARLRDFVAGTKAMLARWRERDE